MLSKEQKQVFKVAKEAVNDDVKMIAQVDSLDLNEAIELGKYATELGMMRYLQSHHSIIYFHLEIKDYYFELIEATQNNLTIAIPDLTGVNISIEQFGELFNHEESLV